MITIKKNKWHRLTRKWHRYLGILFGVQMLAWTLGGLYFSWTRIDDIRGDNLRKTDTILTLPNQPDSPFGWLTDSLRQHMPGCRIAKIELINLLGRTYYQVRTAPPATDYLLYDVQTHQRKLPLSLKEAQYIALQSLKQPAAVIASKYITATNNHHEYREKPLPAYAITFGQPSPTTVYVGAHTGKVESYRSTQWRIFDFFWMLHTMDYQERDNFNNWVIRIFSVFSLLTLISGFLLYFFTFRLKKN